MHYAKATPRSLSPLRPRALAPGSVNTAAKEAPVSPGARTCSDASLSMGEASFGWESPGPEQVEGGGLELASPCRPANQGRSDDELSTPGSDGYNSPLHAVNFNLQPGSMLRSSVHNPLFVDRPTPSAGNDVVKTLVLSPVADSKQPPANTPHAGEAGWSSSSGSGAPGSPSFGEGPTSVRRGDEATTPTSSAPTASGLAAVAPASAPPSPVMMSFDLETPRRSIKGLSAMLSNVASGAEVSSVSLASRKSGAPVNSAQPSRKQASQRAPASVPLALAAPTPCSASFVPRLNMEAVTAAAAADAACSAGGREVDGRMAAAQDSSRSEQRSPPAKARASLRVDTDDTSGPKRGLDQTPRKAGRGELDSGSARKAPKGTVKDVQPMPKPAAASPKGPSPASPGSVPSSPSGRQAPRTASSLVSWAALLLLAAAVLFGAMVSQPGVDNPSTIRETFILSKLGPVCFAEQYPGQRQTLPYTAAFMVATPVVRPSLERSPSAHARKEHDDSLPLLATDAPVVEREAVSQVPDEAALGSLATAVPAPAEPQPYQLEDTQPPSMQTDAIITPEHSREEAFVADMASAQDLSATSAVAQPSQEIDEADVHVELAEGTAIAEEPAAADIAVEDQAADIGSLPASAEVEAGGSAVEALTAHHAAAAERVLPEPAASVQASEDAKSNASEEESAVGPIALQPVVEPAAEGITQSVTDAPCSEQQGLAVNPSAAEEQGSVEPAAVEQVADEAAPIAAEPEEATRTADGERTELAAPFAPEAVLPDAHEQDSEGGNEPATTEPKAAEQQAQGASPALDDAPSPAAQGSDTFIQSELVQPAAVETAASVADGSAPDQSSDPSANQAAPSMALSIGDAVPARRFFGWTVTELCSGCVCACIVGVGLAVTLDRLSTLRAAPAAGTSAAPAVRPEMSAFGTPLTPPSRILRLKTPLRMGKRFHGDRRGLLGRQISIVGHQADLVDSNCVMSA
ncbi:hypothetical protein HYH03_009382 [Edaphochlamys debaryana]|uniref:Uncharacterized protein n=1 Tax=Edaphochlamys debaryana TaxID=47281 RepID=A0A835Y7J4_9CHLO|nr:hypothetical protein HYH03_009382 [Edaphochlamys debaryana]|eukprot:KAG2492439.1 hypothetical protein HYH03_009382 [Edaphochlamys debaryana]